MSLKKKLFLLLALETLITSLPTWADIILATGIAGIGVPDTDFRCISPGGNAAFTPVGIPEFGSWVAPITGTHWIGPVNGNTTGLAGWYECIYKFKLDSIDCSPFIEGKNASDNGLQIFLNRGKIFDSVDITNPGWERAYDYYHPFSASSNFVIGTNILTFRIINAVTSPIGFDVNAYIKTCP